jgi:hypothetical protein
VSITRLSPCLKKLSPNIEYGGEWSKTASGPIWQPVDLGKGGCQIELSNIEDAVYDILVTVSAAQVSSHLSLVVISVKTQENHLGFTLSSFKQVMNYCL